MKIYHKDKWNFLFFNRYSFYCANSYKDANDINNAVKWYKNTLKLNNWYQEKYISCMRLYDLYDKQNKMEEGIYYLIESYKYDNTRVEGIYNLIKYYCIQNQDLVSYKFYELIQNYYENDYINDNFSKKLFVNERDYSFFLPYYMILVSDKVKDYETTLQMYKIIFTKKHIERSKHYIGNMLYNLQFFIEHDIFKNDTEFFKLFQEYIDFLVSINYPIYDHNDFMIKYEKYGVKIPKFTDPVFSLDECFKSKNILVYTGYAPSKWNYTFSLSNALGGSETAISCLTKNFPDDYTIYVTGDVEEEKIDNVTYIHSNNLNRFSQLPF